jgi:2,4-dienoyl-CoA reductase-like NADH-dependent reductase (Old Yellow Enzyme family)
MDVFDGIAVNALKLKNRFVRSATWEGMATEKGGVTPPLTLLMKNLAEGGAGLLISSHMYVREDGQASPRQLGIHDDSMIAGLRGMCDAVHEAGTTVFAQLAHGGANGSASLTGRPLLAPSETENGRDEKAGAMTEAEIAALVGSFADAARRAVEAGFDGVQVHAAHAYCLGQFLSPYYNSRTDRYGGSIENRARALVEVCRAVRGAVGKNFPVTVKINSEDFIDGGFTPPMMAETSAIMESEGLDAMEMSGGGNAASPARYFSSRVGDPKTHDEEVYYRDAARLYKERVKKMPLLLVGGIRSIEVARQLLSDGLADMISLCRPLIREPGLVKRWASGDVRRAACVSCDGCRKPALSGEGVRCVLI